MVLLDIADDAKFVKVTTASFGAKWFFESDLNVVNHPAVKHVLNKSIAETERKNIFYHFFAKIVVDTERLSLAPCAPHFLEHVFARLKITSERLFNHDAIHIVFRVAVLA